MPGADSITSNRGVLSETLAEYLFSTWGPVTRVRWENDFGWDLHCAMTEPLGQLRWVKTSYNVQVKSNFRPWCFNSPDEVRWLIEHPEPLFLCVVDKKKGQISVYQTHVRFGIWASGQLPTKIKLKPGNGTSGNVDAWTRGPDCQLSAPIIKITAQELFDDAILSNLQRTLNAWVDWELRSIQMVRMGLFRSRSPLNYQTNTPELNHSIREGEMSVPTDQQISLGARTLREVLDCLGSQFFYRGDHLGFVKASLLFRWLSKRFGESLDDPRSIDIFPALERLLSSGMGKATFNRDEVFEPIDALANLIENHPITAMLDERRSRFLSVQQDLIARALAKRARTRELGSKPRLSTKTKTSKKNSQ